MRDFTEYEIIKLNENDIDNLIIGNTFLFKTNSKDSDKEIEFKAKVIALNLSFEEEPFNFEIIIENEDEIKNLLIIGIKSMKYVC
jgi:hypothetical protein